MKRPVKKSQSTTRPVLPEFTRAELLLINNALNEVCHGVNFEDDEFETRLSVPRAVAQDLLKKVAELLNRGESHATPGIPK